MKTQKLNYRCVKLTILVINEAEQLIYGVNVSTEWFEALSNDV